MRREFGSCATNIAYGLKLLGDRGVAMATAGHDFGPYPFDRMLICRSCQWNSSDRSSPPPRRRPLSPPTWITIKSTAFHPDAMQFAHLNKIADAGAEIRAGIVAPDGRQAMIKHAAQFHAASIPFIFDPGRRGCPCLAERSSRPLFGRHAGWR